MRTLYRAAAVRSAGRPGATALLVDDGRVAWVGVEGVGGTGVGGAGIDRIDEADAVVDLREAVITPAFVDAHAHVTETGLLLGGVDLRGVRDLATLLDRVSVAARQGGPVLGHGWDESLLAEGRPPTAAELARAADDAVVYLSRVDVHSAVISPALAAASGAAALVGWDDSGRVERDAHHAARDAVRGSLTPAARRRAQLAALRAAAAAGIAAVHEMSAPHLASEEDLRELVALAAEDAGAPRVIAYRAELVPDERAARDLVARLGVPLAGLAGDLCVDGSVGSRTAAWRQEYADAAGEHGHLYLTVEQVRDHVAACTRAGLQAGFHVIGDAAVQVVRRGVRRAAEQVGIAAVRAAGHRLEHVEAVDAHGVADLADLGLIASVQPAFDALWGGDHGLYAARLGARRAVAMNPLASLASAGVVLAFGSDSPVTPFDPWGAVRAATHHHVADQRLSLRAACAAHTVGGWRAAGVRGGAGTLEVGAPATFAAWVGELPAPVGGGRPACVLTVSDGRVLHDAR